MKRKFLKWLSTLGILVSTTTLATAQDLNISGRVVDAAGEPVVGASVVVKGTSTGVTTGMNGDYDIAAPGDATLTFSFLGMGQLDVAVNGRARLDVRLTESDQELQEVIVVGYGTQKKKDVMASIAKVDGSNISNMAAPSFDQQLAGRSAGVNVVTQGGTLGQAPQFQIRGFATISSGSQPLVVIDGTPVNSGQIQQLYALYNPLSDISPNDIASIEILKDGAATAIYGSRAANGVVLITTKKGSKSNTKVTYDMYLGAASPIKLHELLNAEEFVTISNEKWANWGMREQAVLDPSINTNWNDYIYQTGFQQNHAVSASGGTDKSQYYAGLGYSDMTGIIRSNTQERFNVTANVTQKATKWLSIGANVNAARTTLHGFQNSENGLGGLGFASVRMLPNVPVYDADDKTGYNIDAANRKALGRGPNLTYIDNGIQNIVWALDNNQHISKSTRVIGGGYGEVKFLEGLTFRTQAGVDLTLLNDFMSWDAESGDGVGYNGALDEVNTTYYNWNWQNMLSFDKTFAEKHNLNATLVQEYTYSQYEYTDAYVFQLSDPFFGKNHIISNTFGEQEVGGTLTFNGLASYLARANYNYAGKYYVGGSVRYDGLSKLHKDSRWGLFWGGSAAYRISEESFYQPLKSVVDDLRVRVSAASVGNADVGNFPYINTYGAKLYGEQGGIGWSNFGNDKLQWEKSTTYDVGLDGRFLNGRYGFEITYFQKETKDLVMEVPTAPSLGIPYNSYYDNVGAVRNSGVEITLNGTPVDFSGFRWSFDLNLSFVKNKVLTLLNGEDIIDNYTVVREGESYKSIYGYDYYGVNKVNGNPIWRKADGSLVQFNTFGDSDNGEVEYDYAVYDPANPADVSQESSLSATTDRKVLGSSLPTYFGGFNNTFTYKGFDLNIFLRFSGGNKIMNATRQSSLLQLEFSNNGKEILGRWVSPENPGDGKTPKIGYKDGNVLFNDGYSDSHFVEDGDFVRLANLSLGYTLPSALTQKVGLSKARVYVQAQNLLTLTKYSGLDPETSTRRGVDWNGMPQQKVFLFGINLTF